MLGQSYIPQMVHGVIPMLRPLAFISLAAMCALPVAAAAAQQGDRQATANAEEERPICRRVQETGSLVRTRRQCFTRAEWDRIAEAVRRGAQNTVSGLAGGYNGNN